MTEESYPTEQQLRSLENSMTLWKVEKMISLARRVLGPEEAHAGLIRWAHNKMQKAADSDPSPIIFLIEDMASQKVLYESLERRNAELNAKIDKIQRAVIEATIEHEEGCATGKVQFLEACMIYPDDSRIPKHYVTLTSTVEFEVPAFIESRQEVRDFVCEYEEVCWEDGQIEVER